MNELEKVSQDDISLMRKIGLRGTVRKSLTSSEVKNANELVKKSLLFKSKNYKGFVEYSVPCQVFVDYLN